jgi:signal transduction histidine kinase
VSDSDSSPGESPAEDDLHALAQVGLVAVDDGTPVRGPQFETLMPVLRALEETRTAAPRERPHRDGPADDPSTDVTGDEEPSEGELVSLVAHDLRGPIAQASGWLALAREDGDEESFDGVEAALERMSERVEDLVRLAGDGAGPAATETVSLAETAERVWEELVADRMTEGGRLVVESDRTVPVVADRLERLLANLLRNALIHGRGTRPPVAGETGAGHAGTSLEPNGGTTLTVRVGPLPDGFYVEDDGVGIPEAERERVFAAGYSAAGGGSGLGLASVAQVAAAHGWDATLTAAADGGARFEFTDVGASD